MNGNVIFQQLRRFQFFLTGYDRLRNIVAFDVHSCYMEEPSHFTAEPRSASAADDKRCPADGFFRVAVMVTAEYIVDFILAD